MMLKISKQRRQYKLFDVPAANEFNYDIEEYCDYLYSTNKEEIEKIIGEVIGGLFQNLAPYLIVQIDFSNKTEVEFEDDFGCDEDEEPLQYDHPRIHFQIVYKIAIQIDPKEDINYLKLKNPEAYALFHKESDFSNIFSRCFKEIDLKYRQ